MILPLPLALKRLAAALRVFSLGMGRLNSTQSIILLPLSTVKQDQTPGLSGLPSNLADARGVTHALSRSRLRLQARHPRRVCELECTVPQNLNIIRAGPDLSGLSLTFMEVFHEKWA